MNMSVLATFVLGVITLSCGNQGRSVISFDEACTGAANRKVSVEGLITSQEKSCSSGSVESRECSMWLADTERKHNILFSLAEGSGPNQAEKSADDSLKIRGASGNVIDSSNKVVLTGKTTLLISSTSVPLCKLDDAEISQ